MRRIAGERRLDWERRVEDVGLVFHHTPEGLYWDESTHYEFSADEVDMLERATNELHEMCLTAAQHVIDHERFDELAIPPEAVSLIKLSWEEEPPAVYGRFDFAYDGHSPPKLLEYNADTPTSLLESSVVQWFWLQDTHPDADQFNSIHERLIAKWTELWDYLLAFPLYFTCIRDSVEDRVTTSYLQDTAEQAGILTAFIAVEDIGWDHERRQFVDLNGRPITNLFKLYPWEWLLGETFGPYLIESHAQMQWIEPIWKLLLSNKGLLPILWELYPGHPNLLAAYRDHPHGMPSYVRKPIFSREGANVTLHADGCTLQETDGDYGEEGYIFQQMAPLACFDGSYPIIGSWVIDQEAAGIGIRESTTLITDNVSRFVPHLFRPDQPAGPVRSAGPCRLDAL